MNNCKTILIIDDEKIFRESLYHWFIEEEYNVIAHSSGEAGLKALASTDIDVVLLDLMMPGMSGLETLERIKLQNKDIPVIVITAFASVSTAIHALKEGAFDYVTKPVDPNELTVIINKAISAAGALKYKHFAINPELLFKTEGFFYKSEVMTDLLAKIGESAGKSSPVILEGNMGVEFESVAKMIHCNSERRNFPFTKIGIHKGELCLLSFFSAKNVSVEYPILTGAAAQRILESSKAGTLFIENIGHFNKSQQLEILRIIDTFGETSDTFNSIENAKQRIIASTELSLVELVKENRFLPDLYYFLSETILKIASLNERKEDIPFLANYYLHSFAEEMNKVIAPLQNDIIEELSTRIWKGDVRELKNLMEKLVLTAERGEIKLDDLFTKGSLDYATVEKMGTIYEIERRYILKNLFITDWNISQTAKNLGIDRATLYNKIKKYDLREERS